jgi:hypothetical protein
MMETTDFMFGGEINSQGLEPKKRMAQNKIITVSTLNQVQPWLCAWPGSLCLKLGICYNT